MDIIAITAYGRCEPAGSKKAFQRPGARFPQIVDANPRAAGWKSQIARASAEQYDGALLEGALSVTLRFFQARPLSHMGSGRNAGVLKDSAPARPIVAPDVDKLSRAVLDGLQGQLYRNDSQVVSKLADKLYGTPERVEIEVAVLSQQTVGEQRADEQMALA
jgi:Holliday junction resolvase RusA-like endonuclease